MLGFTAVGVAAGAAGTAAILALLFCAYSPEAARTALEYGALRARRAVEEGAAGGGPVAADQPPIHTKPVCIMRPPRMDGVTPPPLLSPHPFKDKDA